MDTIDLPEGMPKELLNELKKVWVAGQQINISPLGEERKRRVAKSGSRKPSGSRRGKKTGGDKPKSRKPKDKKPRHKDKKTKKKAKGKKKDSAKTKKGGKEKGKKIK